MHRLFGSTARARGKGSSGLCWNDGTNEYTHVVVPFSFNQCVDVHMVFSALFLLNNLAMKTMLVKMAMLFNTLSYLRLTDVGNTLLHLTLPLPVAVRTKINGDYTR